MFALISGRTSTNVRRRVAQNVRTLETLKTPAGGAIGEDGRHEIWREGIYDHDNEPK